MRFRYTLQGGERMNGESWRKKHLGREDRHWRRGLLAFTVAAALLAGAPPALAGEDHIEPLGSAWQNVIVPKFRGIVSFMDTDYSIKTYRGQGESMDSDLSKYYGTNVFTTTPANLGLSGSSSSRVFSQTQAAGVVPQTVTLTDDFLGSKTYSHVPTGIFCTSYLTKLNDDGSSTALWMELTGRIEGTATIGRIGRVKIDGINRPYYKYKFNADLQHKDAPALDKNVAHDMVAWDWNKDGYTDWLVSYITNPKGKDDHENMKVAFLFVDGKSLYNKCRGTGNVSVWTNTDCTFTTGGDVVGGLTTKKPPNSVRTAIGDMDGDGNPEVALHYTQVNGSNTLDGGDHSNHMNILRLTYNGSTPTWSWFYKTDGIGNWYVQYNSVTVAMGDLDGDTYDELVVLHGKSGSSASTSKTYLDVLKLVNGSIKKVVDGEEVGETSKMPDDDDSTPALEACVDDFDGDGIDELVWTGTDSDHSTRLYILVHKWPVVDGVVKLSGKGNKYSYELVKIDDGWRMDDHYIKYSLSTGMFIYPTTEKLRKQIALASTMDSSSGSKESLKWGVFSWDASAGLKLLGKGAKTDGAMASNVVPTITAADLDGDSMVLGEPTGFTVYDNIEPVFIIQAPPRHWDILSVNGTNKTMDAFSVLNGYSTTMTGKTTDASAQTTTKTSSGHWGASAGITVAKVNVFKENAKMFDAGIKYAGEAASKNTSGKTVTTTASLTAVAQYDDQIYFRANTHDVWRYPVLSPASQAFVVVDGVSYRRFVQFIVPQVIQSSFASTAGKEVDWYEPWHNGLNLFSYPRTLEQTRDYPQGASTKPEDDFWKDINGLVLAKSTGQIMGNVDSTSSNFTMEVKTHEEELHSLKNTVSAYANLNLPSRGKVIKVTGSFGLTGDYSYGTDSITTSDKSKLGGVTVSWPGVASYISPSGLTPSDQQFTVDASIYTTDSGTVSFAYAVTNLYKKYSALWGDDSPYNKTPDPALNLPRQWVINAGKWQANPFPGDAARLRGLLFQEASIVQDSGGISGQALPINTPVHAVLRVYNYSFVATGKVTATLSFQPITSTHDDPDVTKATALGSTTIPSIPGRNQGTSNNWQDLGIQFTTHGKQTMGYLHAMLSTEGGNLQTANDHGYILVGVYDPAQQPLGRPSVALAHPEAASGKKLNIVAGSLSVRPLNADGSLGEETTQLEPGRAAVIQGAVRYDRVAAGAPNVLFNVSVYLRNMSTGGVLSHRTLPMVESGAENVVRMLFTAPDTAQTMPLQMIVTSDTLPAADDENPAGRVASRDLTVGNPNSGGGSSGGCALGLVPGAPGLVLLPLLLLLKKR